MQAILQQHQTAEGGQWDIGLTSWDIELLSPALQAFVSALAAPATRLHSRYADGNAPLVLPPARSERHGGLAVRLSRYREDDPLLRTPAAEAERRWIGQDNPSLQAHMDDSMTVGLPEYDRRRGNSACIIDITAAP